MDHFTVFDLRDVAHDDLRHFDLDHLASSHHGELLLLLDAALEAAELLLFAPVVEGRDQDHTHHRQQDGGALDPSSLGLAVVFHAAGRTAAVWTSEKISAFTLQRLRHRRHSDEKTT